MKRRPEPELMDTQVQAEAYAEADFTEPDEPFLRQDFHHSLFAAFGPAEGEGQLREVGLEQSLSVQVVSNRYLAVLARLP